MPFWAKDIKVGFANINPKAEGIEGKPAAFGRQSKRNYLMPRVVPSQIVTLADRIFSQLPDVERTPEALHPLQAPEISTRLPRRYQRPE